MASQVIGAKKDFLTKKLISCLKEDTRSAAHTIHKNKLQRGQRSRCKKKKPPESQDSHVPPDSQMLGFQRFGKVTEKAECPSENKYWVGKKNSFGFK